jgi:hypothetical protein
VRAKRLFPALLLGFGLGPLGGCSSPAGPAPVPCTQVTVFSNRSQLPASTQQIQAITTTAVGRLSVIVDWASSDNVMSMVLAQAPCSSDQLAADEYNVLFSLFSPPKPLQDSTTLLRPGTYDLIIANPNSVPEMITSHVLLLSAGCP